METPPSALGVGQRGCYIAAAPGVVIMVESTIEDPHHLRSGATASIPRWSRLLKMKRRRAGTGESGVWRGQKNDTGKPSSNPKGWPDRYKDADLEERRHRKIILNDEQELWFCDNFVRTSKVRAEIGDLSRLAQ